MRRITLFATVAALAAAVQAAEAQTPQLSLEGRGGFAVPIGEWNEDEVLKNGVGYGASIIGMFTPQIGVYAGWETYEFSIDEDEPGVSADATDVGYRAGISLSTPPLPGNRITPFVEAGVIYNVLEIGANSGGTSLQILSDRSLGFEGGVGVVGAVNPRISVVPTLRYRRHDVEFDAAEGLDAETVEYVVLSVGLRLHM